MHYNRAMHDAIHRTCMYVMYTTAMGLVSPEAAHTQMLTETHGDNR